VKIVLLGGAGLMARATARDLLDRRPDVELVLADVNVQAAQAVEEGLRGVSRPGRHKISPTRVDASDVEAVRETIRGADAVINAARTRCR
jgi:saccharopine dehydrogenase-like NADP-dependent oxidoreductase